MTLGITALDQVTKWLITRTIPLNGQIELLPVLNMVYIYNRGATFGILNRADINWQFWFFLLPAVVVLGVIIHLARNSQSNSLLFTGLGLVLGGAFGNLVDRVRMRAVLDFIHCHLGAWDFPAFNLADTAITVGAVLSVWMIWRMGGEEKKE